MLLPNKTIADIRALRPCYDPVTGENEDGDIVHAGGFLSEAWEGTALDVLRVEACPAEDRVWVVLHEGWMPREVWERFARWCALQVIHLWDAPEVVRRFLETGEEASAAASAAAWAESAAARAAWEAAAWAESAAAWAAAWAAQVNKLIELLEVRDE